MQQRKSDGDIFSTVARPLLIDCDGMGNNSSLIRAIERLEESQRAAQEQARAAQEQARAAQEQARRDREQARRDRELLLATIERNQAQIDLVLTSTFAVVYRESNAYDRMSETAASDAKDARTNFMRQFDMREDNVKCALTGLRGKTKLAHILPRKANKHICGRLGMSNTDLNNNRNLIFLCYNIEAAFDAMRISFVPQDVLHDTLIMKIWDESVRNEPIFSGSESTIGEFEERALNSFVEGSDGTSRENRPFRRCFAYQALMCYCRHNIDLNAMPPFDPRNSETLLEYKSLRENLLEMHAALQRQLQRETAEQAQPCEEEEEDDNQDGV